ncbi:hypothetical protein [Fulvivirga sediminis]|uniref:Uncharacterized protein n=1 Tax=Fulvivirga sediminis TaxID=2803949 RepID=A0A937FDN6_9BACT|nr:hypothetical protein [Fulvivirga sediminis]MBL3658849.1 hypothetical protein [Fulvivirga sediminis]
MLKFLKRAAIVMLLLLLALYLYLQLRQSRSYNNIPEGANLVMRANIDQLFKKLLFNSLTNPKYYYQSSSDSTDTDDETEDPSFVIPANVFVYNLGATPNTFYTSLHIKDSTGIQAFLKKKLSIDQYLEEDNFTYGFTDNHQLQVIYNEDRAFLSLSIDRQNVKSELKDLLFNLKPMDRNTPIITALRDADSDISLLGESNELNVDFNTGEVIISGLTSFNKYLKTPNQASVKQPLDSLGLHAWLSATPTDALDTLFTINHITLSGDTLRTYYHNAIDFQIAETTLQSDTIITYDYNDDFEKVEQKEIKTSKVPGICIAIKCDSDAMQRYLKNKGILDNAKVNESFFPLYSLNTTQKDSLLIIHNLTDYTANYKSSEKVMGLYVDFNQLQTQLPILNDKVDYLSKAELYGSKEKEKLKLEGSIKMTQSDLNALIQFIKK